MVNRNLNDQGDGQVLDKPTGIDAVRAGWVSVGLGEWEAWLQGDARLPWGGKVIPAWIIDWWKELPPLLANWERTLPMELGIPLELIVSNSYFQDFCDGSKYSAPYCRLYAYYGDNERLEFADVIASGVVVNGWASIDCPYRFKDLIEQTGSLDS